MPGNGDFRLREDQNLKSRMRCMLESGLWTDCNFLVGKVDHQVTFRAHRQLLAFASPVFEAMFYGSMAETKDPIVIPDIQPDAFKALLLSIYTDDPGLTVCSMATGMAYEVMYAAQKYMMPRLTDHCALFLNNMLSLENAAQVYEVALLFDEHRLMFKSLKFITTEASKVLKETSFRKLELSTVVNIFGQDHLEVTSEMELFRALERYAQARGLDVTLRTDKDLLTAQGKNTCEVPETNNLPPMTVKELRKAIENIRFLNMSLEEFAEGPARSPLLSPCEAMAVMVNIADPNTIMPMPDGFSRSKELRNKRILYKPRNQNTSEIIFQFQINNFRTRRGSVCSPWYETDSLTNLCWRLEAEPSGEKHNKKLGLSIKCDTRGGPVSWCWSCRAEVTISLIDMRNQNRNRSVKFNYLFTRSAPSSGLSVPTWPEICDSTQGFLRFGSIWLQVHIVADPTTRVPSLPHRVCV